MGVLACRFLQFESLAQGSTAIPSAPTVVCGVLIVPLFDSLRVFILRVKQGNSPFKADRQHIHHRLLQLGCTHLEATLILIGVNIFFIVLSYMLRGIGIVWLMGLIVALACVMSYILVTAAKARNKKAFDLGRAFYASLEIWKESNKVNRLTERQHKKIVVKNYAEEVNVDLN